jgi:type IV secretion system protein TrbB
MSEKKTAKRHLDMLTTAFGEDIAKLMYDKDVIEIMVNPDGKLWVECLTKGKYFSDIILEPKKIANVIKLVAAYRHAIADQDHPEVACELPETGARFQGWLPPVVSEPTFTIRKKAIQVFSLEDYIAAKSMTASQAKMLKQAVKNRKNILIAGGTASGKTTFANALLRELKDSKDRVVVLEDLPELQVKVKDCVTLRTTDAKNMRDLVKGVLRMRPDRIIIGEVRDGAALDLLKAWNTGHPGGICTIHANSAQATISRLEDLVHEVVTVVPKRLIRESVDIVVFMQREHGKYLVSSIDDVKLTAK